MIESNMVFKDHKGNIFEETSVLRVGDSVILNAFRTGDAYLTENKWFGCAFGIGKARKRPLEIMRVWNYVKVRGKHFYEVKNQDGTTQLLPHELLMKEVKE